MLLCYEVCWAVWWSEDVKEGSSSLSVFLGTAGRAVAGDSGTVCGLGKTKLPRFSAFLAAAVQAVTFLYTPNCAPNWASWYRRLWGRTGKALAFSFSPSHLCSILWVCDSSALNSRDIRIHPTDAAVQSLSSTRTSRPAPSQASADATESMPILSLLRGLLSSHPSSSMERV